MKRVLIAVGVTAGVTATVVTATAVATPAAPDTPQTVASVTAKLTALARTNDALSEQFNAAQIVVSSDQKKAQAAAVRATQAQRDFAVQRDRLGQAVAVQYESSVFSQAGALLTSDSGSGYLDSMRDLDALNLHQSDMLATLTKSKAAADNARSTATALLATATSTRDALAAQRTKLTADIGTYKQLLATLTAAQQAAYAARDKATPAQIQAITTTVHAGNKAAQKAVDFALKQVGKPYVFATAGPSTYDCSGLTMAAWAAAGVSLPHQSAEQYGYGTHVAESALQPGDLVFFYRPAISHVAMYIGDGLLVSAPEPGENVEIVALSHFQSDYVGATRLT